MPSNSGNSDPSTKATFLFKGTIREVKSAWLKQVPVDKNTVVVMVDQVLEASKNLAKLGGHRVTVQLTGRQKVQVGQEFIFHTHSWIFGESVALQSLKEEAIKPTKAHAALLSRGGDPVVHGKNRQVQERFASADVVVSGRVTTVRLLAEAAAPSKAAKGKGKTRAAMSTTTAATGPVSEHSPHWREAVVEIDDVHKGQHAKKSMVIRFPVSTDVRWYKAPKFQAGHQGFFMLRKTKLTEEPKASRRGKGKARVVEPAAVEVFTALHPVDFQPYSQSGGVRRIIETNNAQDSF